METIDLIAARDSLSPVTEAYRAIRTNLLFGSAGKPLQTIGILSAKPGEGKSTTCINMAITMAQAGTRVLIIDCDLRKPSLHRKCKLPNRGLTNFISLGEELESLVCQQVEEGLDVLACGPVPPNPADLLLSKRMQEVLDWAKSRYDYVFLDFPPILFVSDAFSLVKQVDTYIWVVESGALNKEEMLDVNKRIQQNGASVLGLVMNKVEKSKDDYYYY